MEKMRLMDITFYKPANRYEPLKTNSADIKIVFRYDAWNDFGYNATFTAIYNKNELGLVKLYVPKVEERAIASSDYSAQFDVYNYLRNTNNSKQKDTVWPLEVKIYQDEVKLSLGSKSYYSHIKEQIGDEAENYLNTVQDAMVIDVDVLEKYYNYPMVKYSLRRNSQSIYDLIILAKKCKFETIDVLKIVTFEIDSIKALYDKAAKDFQEELLAIYDLDYEFADKLVEVIDSKHKSDNLDDTDRGFLQELERRTIGKPILLEKISDITSAEKSINEAIKEIKESLILAKVPDDCELGQYTRLETIPLILNRKYVDKNDLDEGTSRSIKHKYLRLSNSNQMNDPKEGKTLLNFLKLEDQQIKDYVNSSVYVSSATSNLDSLPMWKQYASDTTGAVMVYDTEFINMVCNNDNYDLVRVCYIKWADDEIIDLAVPGIKDDDEIESIKKNLTSLREEIASHPDNSEKIKGLLGQITPFFKNFDYEYESEYRIVSYQEKNKNTEVYIDSHSENSIPKLYMDLKESKEPGDESLEPRFSKIILGPKALHEDYIAPYIKFQNPDIKVLRSSILYR